jgi:hypothetical protein
MVHKKHTDFAQKFTALSGTSVKSLLWLARWLVRWLVHKPWVSTATVFSEVSTQTARVFRVTQGRLSGTQAVGTHAGTQG